MGESANNSVAAPSKGWGIISTPPRQGSPSEHGIANRRSVVHLTEGKAAEVAGLVIGQLQLMAGPDAIDLSNIGYHQRFEMFVLA